MALQIFEKYAFHSNIVGYHYKVLQIDRGIQMHLNGLSDNKVIYHYISKFMNSEFASICKSSNLFYTLYKKLHITFICTNYIMILLMKGNASLLL